MKISKKAFLTLAVLLLIDIVAFAQSFEISKSFSFDRPFKYYQNFDRVEGRAPGISLIGFMGRNLVTRDSSSLKWFVFDKGKTGDQFTEIADDSHGSFFVDVGRYYLFGTTYSGGIIRIYRSDNSDKTPDYVIKIPKNQIASELIKPETIPYLSDNFVFAQTVTRDLISWELLPTGITLYRGISDTKKWLAAGNGDRIGYSLSREEEQVYFGDFSMDNQALHIGKIWNNLIFPEGNNLQLSSLRAFQYLGGDSKGLSYFYAINPPSITWKELYQTKPFSVIVAIVDTWTRKVLLRELPVGDWNPPRIVDYGVSVAAAKLDSRNGDVYFVDVDETKREFQLKLLRNNWWRDFGVDKRKIARIVGNHVALQEEPSMVVANNGYNFENDFVWVIAESSKSEIVGSKTIPWVKVRKVDGREGWILLSSLYFQ